MANGAHWQGVEVCLKLMRVENRDSWERERDAYLITLEPDLRYPALNHAAQFLLKFYGSFEYQGQLVLVLDLAKENLIEYVNRRRWSKIPRKEIRELIRGICSGLKWLHSKGVAHRDIKPDNILLSESGAVLVADLGVACQVNKRLELKGYVGTRPYMAPEISRDKACRYRMSADMYSLGVLIHTLVCLKTPKSDNTNMPINAIKGWGEAKELVDNLLQEDPKQRWTMKVVLNHSFFTDDARNINAKGDSLGSSPVQVSEGGSVPAAENKTSVASSAGKATAP
ncbi:hypothetical protein EC957_011238 [Mortierella hygrophila]|uniref:Protein kinase domain-containing protein n=1 Tax=Mortierella hygrophila TaxID=979708 RepID=A0A9P6EW90_9FUNG|nr:hypothetical protein EC957_011238 [Mortierella hygrophila]